MKKSKASLFLLEMTLALMIFAVCAGICVLVFAGSAANTAQSRDLDNASLLAQNEAERIKAQKSGSDSSVYYGEDLEPTGEDGRYLVKVTFSPASEGEGVRFFHVAVISSATGEPIYEIDSGYIEEGL